MVITHKVYSHTPDGTHCLGLFGYEGNARCFMYAWAGQKAPDKYPDYTMQVVDNDGWRCEIVPAGFDIYAPDNEEIVMDTDSTYRNISPYEG